MRIEDPQGKLIFAGYYNLESLDQVTSILKVLLPINKLTFKPEFIENINLDDTNYIFYRNPSYFLDYLDSQIALSDLKPIIPSDLNDSPLKLYTKEEIENLAEQERIDIFSGFDFNLFKSVISSDLVKFKVDPDLLKFYKAKFVDYGLFKAAKVDYTSELSSNQTNEFSRDRSILFHTNISLENEISGVINSVDYHISVDSVCRKLENLFSHEAVQAELAPKGQFIIDEMYYKNIKKAISSVFENLSKISYLSPYRGVTRRIFFSESGGSQFSFLLDKFSLQKMSKKESAFVNTWLKTFDAGEKILWKDIMVQVYR